MDKAGEFERRFWRKVAVRRITATDWITNEPCFIFSASCLGAAAAIGTLTLYNGSGLGGDILVELGSNVSVAVQFAYDPPLYFNKGLYVLVTGAGTLGTIQYMLDSGLKGDLL